MIRLLRGLVERVRVLVRRDRFEKELDDELRFVLLMLAAGLVAAVGPALRGLGVQPFEALREE